MKPFRGLLIASLIALPVLANAADVPVSYLVDAVALKSASAGTMLTFELSSDSSCTPVAASGVFDIDDVTVLAVKRFKPAGGTKPPKTAELRAVVVGVSTPGHLYLRVTGTGVTPIAGACQAQAAIGDIPPTCNDTILNQDETDIDCGGSVCAGCAIGQDCLGTPIAIRAAAWVVRARLAASTESRIRTRPASTAAARSAPAAAPARAVAATPTAKTCRSC
jgi:hypothetical protein